MRGTKIARFVSVTASVLVVVNYQKKVVCMIRISDATDAVIIIEQSRGTVQLIAAVVEHLLMIYSDG